MRFAKYAVIALLLAPLAANAQTATSPAVTPDATTQAPPAGAPKVASPKPKLTQAERFQARFDAANTTHDGHLTLEQAKANKWTAVVRRFSKVDTEGKGYVTAEALRADYLAQHAAKAKAKTSPAPAADPAATQSRS